MANRNACLAIGLSAVALAGGARAATLDGAISTALATSPNLGAARADYLRNTANVAIAASHGHLQVALSSTVSHNFSGDPFIPSIRDESSVNVSVPLFSSGRVRNSVAAARLRLHAAVYDIAAQADELKLSVAQTYDELLDSEDGLRIQQQEVDALDRHNAMIESEKAQGFATLTDESQGAARLALARARLEEAVGRRDEARLSYRQTVGVDPGTLVSPAPIAITENVQQLTKQAIAYSPGLQALQDRIRAASRDVQTVRSMGRPTLSLVGSASYGNTDLKLAESMRFPNRLFGQIGLTLTVPLYSGGQVSGREASAVAVVREVQAVAEAEQRRLAANVRMHYDAYQGALQRISVAEHAEETARQALDGVRIEHEAGSRTALDLLNAQRELSETSAAAARARRQAHLEAVALLVRTGTYVNRETPPAGDAPAAPRPAAAQSGAQPEARLAKLDFDLARLPGSKASSDPAALSGRAARTARNFVPMPYALDALG